MAWGRGLRSGGESGPVKQEGDAKAPAGAFVLGSAFGYEDRATANANGYPYIHLHSRVSCIEDAQSPYYNQVLDVSDAPGVRREHRSDMRRADGLFRTGVVIGHNTESPRPGAGSCVFLHIWRGPGQGTAGCTAMQPATIEHLVAWLRSEQAPVLVQLPEPEYRRLKSSWGLPD
jgi:L,D-peptidoglycan transpeptidase YkuD (ErfK/YbiS/YcfS/YnhG family)